MLVAGSSHLLRWVFSYTHYTHCKGLSAAASLYLQQFQSYPRNYPSLSPVKPASPYLAGTTVWAGAVQGHKGMAPWPDMHPLQVMASLPHRRALQVVHEMPWTQRRPEG